MEEMHRARYVGRGTELLCPLWVCHRPQISTCSPTQKLSEPCPLGVYGGFVRRYDWVNHWALVVELNLQAPLPLPGGQGSGTKRSNPQITRLVPMATSTNIRCFWKVTSLTETLVWLKGVCYKYQGTSIALIILDITRVLGALYQEPWKGPVMCISYYKSQYPTQVPTYANVIFYLHSTLNPESSHW